MQYGSDNKTYSDSIVMCYNKQFFSDYDAAKEALINKNSLPGEVTFAYYYDKNSEYGQNAIFSVGPLTQGSNIIYKNANEIDAVVDSLNETIADINSSISNIEQNINVSIDLYNTSINTSLSYISDYILNIENEIQLLDASNNAKHNEIITYMDDVSNNLSQKINKTSNNIIQYINTTIYKLISDNNTSTNQNIIDTSTALHEIIYNYKDELNSTINDISIRLNNFSLTNNIIQVPKNTEDISILTHRLLKIEDDILHIKTKLNMTENNYGI